MCKMTMGLLSFALTLLKENMVVFELALTRTIIVLKFATGKIQWFCHRGNVLVGFDIK